MLPPVDQACMVLCVRFVDKHELLKYALKHAGACSAFIRYHVHSSHFLAFNLSAVEGEFLQAGNGSAY